MPKKRHRTLIRVASNYARLLTTVAFGIILIRLLFSGLSPDAFGLIMLLGSTVGLAAMVDEIVRSCLIRELGAAWHHPDRNRFPVVFNSALGLAAIAATLAACLFAAIALFLPFLRIPTELLLAARVMVFAKAAETFVNVSFSPMFNMYLVSERMLAFNAWMICKRFAYLAAAFIVLIVLNTRDPARAVMLYAVCSSTLFVSCVAIASATLVLTEPRLRLQPRLFNRKEAVQIVRIGAWNLATVIAMNLHLRLDAIIMNVAFGLAGNTMFGIGTQLMNYVRRLTVGMTDGIDAVSARVSSTRTRQAVGRLLRQQTRLNASVAFPAGAAAALLAEPILLVWLDFRDNLSSQTLHGAATITRILAIGITARAVTDGWTRILYGAGLIRHYGPIVLGGGLLNPILAIALLLLLPAGWDFGAPAWAFSIIFTAAHLLTIPFASARHIGLRPSEMFTPLLRPALATSCSAPVLLVGQNQVHQWNLLSLAVLFGAYGTVYLLLASLIILQVEDRRRLIDAIRNISPRPSPISDRDHHRRASTDAPDLIQPHPDRTPQGPAHAD